MITFYSIGGFYGYETRREGDVMDVYQVNPETGKRELIATSELDTPADRVYCDFSCLEYGVFSDESYTGALWNSSALVVASFLVAEYLKKCADMEKELERTAY